jgi:hypothetical protein
MPKAESLETTTLNDRKASELLAGVIRRNVLRALGEPANPFLVQVLRLWERHFRVNILVGETLLATIAHSYFVEADADGRIVTSTPAILRRY